MSRIKWVSTVVLAAGLVAGGCASQGSVGNPLVRKVTWYSFLNGDDIRKACIAGAPDRWRMVLNAVYSEQVRVYELRIAPDGSGTLDGLVFGEEDMLRLASVSSFEDLLNPWRGTSQVAALSESDVERLAGALAADGATGLRTGSDRLESDDFYWVVVGCDGGEVKFDAWTRRDPVWEDLAFAGVLREMDPTGVSFATWKPAPPGSFEQKRREQYRFVLTAGPTGIEGIPAVPLP